MAINCSGWEERWLYQPGRQAFLFNSEFSSLYILCTYFRYHQGFIDNKMEKDRVFTSSQVAEHKSSKDIWFTINGRVLDVTKFLEEHPGGEEVLIEYAGKDATKGYEAIGHSKGAHNLLSKFQVGYLEGYSRSQPDTQSNEQLEKVRAMEAFVIKDDPEQKHSFLIEFLVPALVAALYFGYRCMTGAVFFGS